MSEEQPPGRVRVADEVVASIASTAACEVDGVAAVDQHLGRRLLSGRAAHEGVRVDLGADGTLRLEIFLKVREGAAIPRAAAAVQERVADAIDKMLGLHVTAVDVVVSDVVFAVAAPERGA